MAKLALATMVLCVLAIISGAEVVQAAARHTAAAPARPAFHPRAFNFRGGHIARPAANRNFGRHGLPMVAGRHGRHEARNRSAFAAIPAIFLGGGAPVDLEDYIDSIDDSGPLEPVPPCTSDCKFGAMSMANDGTWGGAWNFSNAEEAKAVALKNCVERTKDRCAGLFVATGTAWIAGLQCERFAPRTSWHWGVMALGNDLPSAIRNVYRIVKQNGFYKASECAFINAVAADGSQLQYTKHQ
jgi:Domain of unknown function (DUF4189)